MTLKICYVTTISETLRSFVLPIVAKLRQLTDWEISFICDYDDDFADEIPEGCKYYPVKMARGLSLDGFTAMAKMREIFAKEQFNIVQYSTPNASLYASIAAKLAGVPIRLYCQWGMAYVGFSGVKRWLFKQIEKTVCGLSTWIEPDSFSNLNFAHKEGLYPESKGSVVWNGSASGVDLAKFNYSKKDLWRKAKREELGVSEDQFAFIFVGRITGDKGINELLEAFREMKDYNDNLLILVGAVEKEESLDSRLLDWAQRDQRVLFCGRSNEVEKYMAAADVYILPSYREGFGSAVVEAEAMGVPVIVSDIPGPIDAMESGATGITVPSKDSEALARAMRTLVSNSSMREEMSKMAVKFAVDKFDQEKITEKIIEDRLALVGDCQRKTRR